MNKQIVIIGASGHGKVVADIAKKSGYADIIFLDDCASVKDCSGYPVIGTCSDVLCFRDSDFIVAIGNTQVRKRIQESLSNAKLQVATLIHPNAVIGENVTLGEGSVVMAGVVINPCSNIGKGCIINTCASVDHDCVVGDYAHISVGAHVAGTVTIGEGTWIGAGATVSNNIEITNNCMIGAGAVVIKNIETPGVYVGLPATRIK